MDIRYLVPVEALMFAGVGNVEYVKGEAGEAAHVHLVGGKSSGCAGGDVIRCLDVWLLNIAVRFLFVADHGEHKSHSVVDTLDTAIGARVLGTCANCIVAEAFEEGKGSSLGE